MSQNSFFRTVYRITSHLPTDYAQFAPAGVHRHQVVSRQRKLKVKFKGQSQMGHIHDFSDGVLHNLFHLRTDYAQVGPAGVYRHQLGSRQRKLKVNIKSQGQHGPKTRFLDGVPHNFSIYRPITPELHLQVCIDTSLDQDKESSRSSSKVKVKWFKNSIFQTV